MGDNAHDPVDHARITRPHAGELMKNTANIPAMVVIGLALGALAVCFATFATGHHSTGVVLGVLSAFGVVIGSAWLLIEHRRVRRVEDRWYADHPDAGGQPPSS
jgi:protein-S-isoprenylcysteine O-methyltransferase Ste14